MRRRSGRGAHGVVRVVRHPVGWITRTLLDGEVRGREHLPQEGPYIVTANHLSLLDPILVTLAVGKLVNFLALDELFGRSTTGDEIMMYFGSIPISRVRPPLGALRDALEVLDDGEILGVFPEGGRAEYWGERPIKKGAAWLALATGSPIVPCSVIGTESTLSLNTPSFHVPSVRLTLHPPMEPATYIDRVDPIAAMMDAWRERLESDLGHWK